MRAYPHITILVDFNMRTCWSDVLLSKPVSFPLLSRERVGDYTAILQPFWWPAPRRQNQLGIKYPFNIHDQHCSYQAPRCGQNSSFRTYIRHVLSRVSSICGVVAGVRVGIFDVNTYYCLFDAPALSAPHKYRSKALFHRSKLSRSTWPCHGPSGFVYSSVNSFYMDEDNHEVLQKCS
ncbi:hypothetical protein HYPSUDRAFT_299901 [Hypholoma sublateritium FD-334 SS-4]|uniref:Uncharacterized protein n=1 Tax=Hypholoma sublateritium (strain FD-334 SS-4) TaxID=945553 RepID=A0A0D2NI15_HYPSF|nr:hypothetical protein HYPSUDRAFT_299901 [Hypholoma sublateritium FD-334 SS-4]